MAAQRPTETTLDRRTFLAASAATAAAAGLGVSATDRASAASVATLPITPTAEAAASSTSLLGTALGSLGGLLNTSPTADRHQLHLLSVNEAEWLEIFHLLMGNRLVDASTIASVEARHGIASAYEDGESGSAAYNRALDRIRAYYAEAPEHNIIEVTNKALAQFSYVNGAGEDTDPTFSLIAGAYDQEETFYQVRIEPEREASTVTRHDGETHTVGGILDEDGLEETSPICRVYEPEWDDDNSTTFGTFKMLSDEIIDSYDPATEEFTIELDGITIDTDLTFTIPNVGDASETGLYSQTVYDHREFVELLEEIESQSDLVVSNYDQGFVDQLYGHFDDGTLDPSQVRGVEGTARFLTGTDDVSESRYRMALLHQFGLEQADLSDVASMVVDYTGATEARSRSIDGEIMGRFPHENSFVNDETFEGLLFARGTPGELQTGSIYHSSPITYLGSWSNQGVKAVNPENGAVYWSASSISTDEVFGIDVSPDGEFLALADMDGNLVILNARTGERILDTSLIGRANDVAFRPDGSSVLVVSESETVQEYSSESGDLIDESNSIGSETTAVAVAPDDDSIVVGGQGEYWRIFDGDLNEVASGGEDEFADGDAAAWTEDSSRVFTIDEYILELDPTDGSTVEIIDSRTDGGQNAVVTNDDTHLITSHDTGAVACWDVSAQGSSEKLWEENVGDYEVGAAPSPCGNRVYASNTAGDWYIFDLETGDQLEQDSGAFDGDYSNMAIRPHRGYADETIADAVMFDAPQGEEHSLIDGTIDLVEMTDSDGGEIESSTYDSPDYDTYDSQEYVEYVETVESYEETLRVEESIGLPSIGEWFDSAGWVGIAIIGGILLLVVGFISDLVPGLGD